MPNLHTAPNRGANGISGGCSDCIANRGTISSSNICSFRVALGGAHRLASCSADCSPLGDADSSPHRTTKRSAHGTNRSPDCHAFGISHAFANSSPFSSPLG